MSDRTSGPTADGGLADCLAAIRACRICRDRPANGKPLPHEPRPVVVADTRASILVCGQAPGTRVHASGRPFDDPSGARLRDWLGVDEATFYDPAVFAFAPMGFCFPGLDAKGGDLPPRRECAPAWRDDLIGRLPHIRLTLLVGSYAQKWHLQGDLRANMTETVRAWRDHAGEGVFPLPHPSWRNTAWLKRNPWFGDELLPMLRRAVREIVSS